MDYVNLLIGAVLFGGMYGLFAVGLSLLLGVMRVFNIAHGAVFAIAALLAITIAENTGWPWPLLVCIGALIGAALGVPLEMAAIRPFRRRELARDDMEHATLLATLAFLFVADPLTTHLTGAEIVAYPRNSFPEGVIRIGEIAVNEIYLIAFVVAIVLVGALALVVSKTQTGRAIRAIASDHRVARLLGVNVGAFSLGIAVVASSLAGVAGVLLSMSFNAVTYDFGHVFLLQGFVIVVLGGLGSIMGTMAAAVMVSVAQNLVAYHAGGSWGQAAVFVLLVFFLIVRPSGIFGQTEVVRA
jgi:branched-chain amino acid transport system permease protein